MTPRARSYGPLAVCATTSVLYVAFARYQWWGVAPIALIVIATAGWWGTVAALRRDANAVPLRTLVSVIVGVSLAMVVFPPRHSRDVFSYSMYGRIVSAHDANPYADVPSKFREDPLFARVGKHWNGTPSRYGPLFTAASAIGTAVLPARPLPLRLWFQGLTLFGALGISMLVWKRSRSPAALAFVALHPLMTLSIINGAHNDVFLGLGALAFVVLLERERFVLAGSALALAALVKLTAVLALVAGIIWLLAHRRVRAAVIAGVACLVPTAVLTLAIPGCFAAVRSASDINVKNSLWYGVQLFFTRESWFPIHGADRSLLDIEQLVKTPALVAAGVGLLVGVMFVVRRSLHDGQRNGEVASCPSGLGLAVAIAMATFSVFPAWVMPWYLIWALPLVPMLQGRLRTTIAAHATVMLCVSHLRGFSTTHVDATAVIAQFMIPFAVVLAYGWAIWSDTRINAGRVVEPETLNVCE